MARQRNEYPREFKLELLRQIDDGEKTASELCRELGLAPQQVSRWWRQLATKGDEAFPGQGQQRGAAAELAELRKENEILKKPPRISPKTSGEVRVYPSPAGMLSGAAAVRGAGGEPVGVLRRAAAAAQCPGAGGSVPGPGVAAAALQLPPGLWHPPSAAGAARRGAVDRPGPDPAFEAAVEPVDATAPAGLAPPTGASAAAHHGQPSEPAVRGRGPKSGVDG